jgi:hypothetical protein
MTFNCSSILGLSSLQVWSSLDDFYFFLQKEARCIVHGFYQKIDFAQIWHTFSDWREEQEYVSFFEKFASVQEL